MKRVFISHSASDSQYAELLKDALRKDFTVAAQLEIGSGTSSLRDELERADAVVLLLSRSAAESSWLNFALGAAEGMGKRVVEVFLDDPTVLSNLYSWQLDQFIDARGIPPAVTAEQISKAISDLLIA